MNRRTFIASVAAAVAAPKLPKPPEIGFKTRGMGPTMAALAHDCAADGSRYLLINDPTTGLLRMFQYLPAGNGTDMQIRIIGPAPQFP